MGYAFMYSLFNNYFNFCMDKLMEDKVKYLLESFIWRFYNTFKVSIFPAVALVLLGELEKTGDLSCLADPNTWGKVGYAVVVSLLTATLAGLDKVSRENIRLEE